VPVFARLHKANPIPLFRATWKFSRRSLILAYDAAFEAAERRNEFLESMRGPEGLSEESRVAAYAEDIVAHQQAGVVLLAADNALWRLSRSLLPIGDAKAGYGPSYNNGVRLTTLLRATTNAIRHVSDWDDDADREDGERRKLYFPYDSPQNEGQQALTSITVIMDALGYGTHERIWIAPSFDVLVTLDGTWYSGRTKADFSKFEAAVQEAESQIIGRADEISRGTRTGGLSVD